MDDDNNKGTGILGLGGTPDADIVRDSDTVRDRDRVTDDEVTRDRARIRDNEEAAREGAAPTQEGTGILGLGGAVVPKSPLDPSASDDLDAAHRRRERMLEGESADRQGATERHAGATGIDMGAGGEGTDVSGR